MPRQRDGQDQPRRQAAAGRSRNDGVVGIFKRAAGGYGFVRPLDAPAGDRGQDIHVAATAALDAASNDAEAPCGDRNCCAISDGTVIDEFSILVERINEKINDWVVK